LAADQDDAGGVSHVSWRQRIIRVVLPKTDAKPAPFPPRHTVRQPTVPTRNVNVPMTTGQELTPPRGWALPPHTRPPRAACTRPAGPPVPTESHPGRLVGSADDRRAHQRPRSCTRAACARRRPRQTGCAAVAGLRALMVDPERCRSADSSSGSSSPSPTSRAPRPRALRADGSQKWYIEHEIVVAGESARSVRWCA
jgi:hypothetical protein